MHCKGSLKPKTENGPRGCTQQALPSQPCICVIEHAILTAIAGRICLSAQGAALSVGSQSVNKIDALRANLTCSHLLCVLAVRQEPSTTALCACCVSVKKSQTAPLASILGYPKFDARARVRTRIADSHRRKHYHYHTVHTSGAFIAIEAPLACL